MKEEKALGFHNVAFDCVNEVFLSYCHSNKFSLVRTTLRVPNRRVSRDPGFPLFELHVSGFLSQIRAKFGIESMQGIREAGNNHRDYGIEGKSRTG